MERLEQPERLRRRESLEHLEQLERLEHQEQPEHQERLHRKKNRRGISGCILAQRIHPELPFFLERELSKFI